MADPFHSRYAFAVVYEGNPNDDDVHGGSHAAPIVGKFLQQALKKEKADAGEPVEEDPGAKKKKKKPAKTDPEE